MVLGLFSCFTAGCGLAAKALPKALEPVDKKRFLEAAKDGNEDRTAECLSDQPDLVFCSGLVSRKTAAHLAAEHGHAHILELLVSRLHSYAAKGLKEGRVEDPHEAVSTLINAQDNDGRTPLSLASEHGHVECARFLLANGADRLIVDDKGNTTLHYACWRCHLGVMFMLLGDQGEDPQSQGGQPPMVPPSPPVNANVAHARSSLGNIINRSSIGNIVTQGGGPPPRPNSTVEREEQNAPQGEPIPAPAKLVNMQNIFGFAPLQYASWSKQPAVVQVLLQYGADMLIRNPRSGTEHSILCSAGSTPLHLAAFRGHIEISRIFLKTFYERFLEPMLLAQASEGADAASITRSLRLVDPRTQLNSLGLMPFQVAHRLGFLALAMLLKPNIPIMRLFSDDERATRLYGPPPLKVICAEALNRKLLTALDDIATHPPAKSKAAKSKSPPPHAPPSSQQHSPPHSTPPSSSPPPASTSPQPSQPSQPSPPPGARAPFPPPTPATRTRMASTPNSPNLPPISAAPNSPNRMYNQQAGGAAAHAPAHAASLSRLSSGVALPTVLEAEDELAGASTTHDRTGSRASSRDPNTASRASTDKQSQREELSTGAPKSPKRAGSSDAPSESGASPSRVGFRLQEEATQPTGLEGESPPMSHSTSHADHLNVVNAAFLGIASQPSTTTSATQSRSGGADAPNAGDSGALPPNAFMLNMDSTAAGNTANPGSGAFGGSSSAAMGAGAQPAGEGAPPSLTLWGQQSGQAGLLPLAQQVPHASEAQLMQQVSLQPQGGPAPPPSPFAAVACAPPASASDAGAETKRNSLERNTTQSHSVNSTHGPPSTADRVGSGMAPRFSNLPGQAMSSLDGPCTASVESQLLPIPPRSNASSPGAAAALARKSSAHERELARKNSGRTPSPGAASPPPQTQQPQLPEQATHATAAVDAHGVMQVAPPQLHSPTPMRPAPRARKPGYAPFSCMRADTAADTQPQPIARTGAPPAAGTAPQASPFASAANNSAAGMAALLQQQQQHSPLFGADRVHAQQAGGPLAPQSSADGAAMTSAVPGMIAGKDASQLENSNSNPIPGMGLPRAGTPPDLYRSVSTKDDGVCASASAPQNVQAKQGAKQPGHKRGISGLFGGKERGSGDSSPTRSSSPFHAAMRRWHTPSPPPPNTGSQEPGPGSDMSTGTGGEGKSLRGSLRGMFNKEGDRQRSTGRSSAERDRKGGQTGRSSLSGLKHKRSGHADPREVDVLATQTHQENEEAHEALGAECGINEEGVTDRAPGETSDKGPRVYMTAQGGTVTLSQTPSMPQGMLDEIVVRDVAGHNTGMARTKTGAGAAGPGCDAHANVSPPPHIRTSHPHLPAMADVCMINSPLRMISRGSQESLFQATSLSGPQIDATGTASREGPSNNMLYNTHLPGEANKSASQSQVDLTRAGSTGAAQPVSRAANSGELASPALRSMRRSRPNVPLGREMVGLARERSVQSYRSLEDLGEEHVPIEFPSPGIAAGPQPSLTRSMRSSGNGSRRSVQQVDDGTLEVEEEEEECGVCMESLATLRLMPCSHTLCGPCAHRMCTMYFQRAPHCPFCRNIIGDISASCLPFRVPTE